MNDSGSSDRRVFLAASLLAAGGLVQEGFRFRLDDGDEAGATWADGQDVSISAALGQTRRLRFVVDADTFDPAAEQYQLECRKQGASDEAWARVI